MTRIRNRGAAPLLLLAAALMLLLFGNGGVVQAQTVGILVLNGNSDDSITSTFDDYDLAQKFTTGSNDLGYTLTHLSLSLLVPEPQSTYPTVKIFSGSANGTEVATLSCPLAERQGARTNVGRP